MKLKKNLHGPLSCTGPLLAACGSPSEPLRLHALTPILRYRFGCPRHGGSAADDSLQKVLDAGKLTIAAEGNWVPYVLQRGCSTGELTGFEWISPRRSAPAWAWSPTPDL